MSRVYNIHEWEFDSPLGWTTAYYVTDDSGNAYGKERFMNIDQAEALQTQLYELDAMLEDNNDDDN